MLIIHSGEVPFYKIMTTKQDQEEELEVLRAIYEEDERFKEINETTVQYMFGESGQSKSLLLEVSWSEEYPETLPDINLDAFYNKHIAKELKTTIVDKIKNEIIDCVGTAMTFTVFQWVGENVEELLADQPDVIETEQNVVTCTKSSNDIRQVKEKKVHLTKNQKRKLADRTNVKGERERGWDWVDIVKHLSKTGSQGDN